MRQLKGIPLNSSSRIIGKISKNPVKTKEAKNCILVTESIEKRPRGYRAVLCSNAIEEGRAKLLKIPIVHSVENVLTLNEGDIVSLDMMNGDIIVVYEKNSVHNSILVSTDCNCRCIMCPQILVSDSPENLRDNLEIIRLIDKKTTALGLTGGEPTLLGDGLIKILKECKKQLPNTQIQMLSNGILLNNNEYVRKIVHLGMKKLVFCIPLYADTDTEHDFIMKRKGAFEDAIQGLYSLATHKQLIEIRIVVMSLNYKRLPRIAEFIYRNLPFAIHVAFMGMEIEAVARKNVNKLWASPKDYAPFLKEAVLYLSQRNMDVSIYNEQLCLMPKELWSFTRKSISEWKNIYLGKCTLCIEKSACGGFFAEPFEDHRNQIRPLKISFD
ncbi:MAG: His-Xaa-Ser system radical SAM maturase HxsC [bacterium]|nr:His-Xaa-Ser system radical SAM maturase HxsC [bacterium]